MGIGPLLFHWEKIWSWNCRIWFHFSFVQPQENICYSDLCGLVSSYRSRSLGKKKLLCPPSQVKRSHFGGTLESSAGLSRYPNLALTLQRLQPAIRRAVKCTPAAANYLQEAQGDKVQMQRGFRTPTGARRWLPDLFRCHKFTDCLARGRRAGGQQKELFLALALGCPCRRQVCFN